MKQAIRDLQKMRNFSEIKKRTAGSEKDRERYSYFEQAYEGALKIINKYNGQDDE